MNKTNIAGKALGAALTAFCALAIGCTSGQTDKGKIAIENIETRASVRSYTDKPVGQQTIDTLLHAAMSAPSAVNRQPWHFVVINDKSVLARIAEASPNAGMAAKAPLAIAVCGDMDKALEGEAREFWVQDASAATENLLLAAHALGLGAVWTGFYPDKARCKALSEILSLPENVVPLNIVVVGYPDKAVAPKDKWDATKVSYNTYGNQNEADTVAKVETAPKAKTFETFDVTKAFRENGFTWFTSPLVLIAGDKNESNAMTIGWGAIGNIWGEDKPTVTVYVRKSRYTWGLMEKSKYFCVMRFKDQKVNEYLGSHSGRDGDKAKALGLHTAYTANGTPYYEEADLVVECKTAYGYPLDEKGFRSDDAKAFYRKGAKNDSMHSIYMGEVVGAMRKR